MSVAARWKRNLESVSRTPEDLQPETFRKDEARQPERRYELWATILN